jgi:hypothetical protein
MPKANTKEQPKLTAGSLKNILWDTLNEVKTGAMDPGNADSIATQAREIIRTTSIQLRISHQTKRPVPADVINFSENVEQ